VHVRGPAVATRWIGQERGLGQAWQCGAGRPAAAIWASEREREGEETRGYVGYLEGGKGK
jgi:hypothetical protein